MHTLLAELKGGLEDSQLLLEVGDPGGVGADRHKLLLQLCDGDCCLTSTALRRHKLFSQVLQIAIGVTVKQTCD